MLESAVPEELTIQAVNKALSREDHSQGALFFRSVEGLAGSWHDVNTKLTKLFTYGSHIFFK